MIGELKAYSDYKHTEHEWLGAIPTHWKLLRAKYIFREVDERSTSGEEELLSVSHLTGVTPRRMKSVTMFLAESNVGHKVCQPNDLVINTLWAWMGALGVSRHVGIVSPAYGVYRPIHREAILPAYADHLLRTPLYAAEYNRRSTGVNSSRLRLYPEQFLRIPLLVPPPDEQAAIVRFLDWLNGRLDRTIRAKRKVIALLDEQKQAIVYRAVTCGFDSSVPLKSSGIPWLGDIPKHWEIRRLKSLSEFVTSGSRGWARYYADTGSVFLRIGNISTSSIDLRLKRISFVQPPKDAEGERTRTRRGDLLLSITAQIGAVGVVPEGLGEAFVNQHTALIRLRTDQCPRWVAYSLLSRFGKDQCRLLTNGGTKVGLTLDDVRGLKVPSPSVDEQLHIVRELETQTRTLDAAIVRLEREISLVEEYRARIVADVVTGKQDVREAAAHLPDELASEATPDNDASLSDEAYVAEEEETIP